MAKGKRSLELIVIIFYLSLSSLFFFLDIGNCSNETQDNQRMKGMLGYTFYLSKTQLVKIISLLGIVIMPFALLRTLARVRITKGANKWRKATGLLLL